jgi:hypothetical protein
MKTAVFVRDIECDSPHVRQKLYKISPVQVADCQELVDGEWQQFIETYEYVVVSASNIPALPDMPFTRVCETFIFAAREDGDWVNSIELEGSTRDVLDHTYALNAGGWLVVAGELESDEECRTQLT